MRRSLALLSVLAACTVAGSVADAKPGHTLFGIVGDNGNAQLTALNPTTLQAYGPRVRLRTASGWSFSPGKEHLAIATGMPEAGAAAHATSLRVIDLRSMRRLMNVRLGGDPRLTGNYSPVGAVAWLSPTRIVLVHNPGNGDAQLVVVDTSRRRVVSRTTVTGQILDSARAADELLLLLGERDAITAPRLVAVDAAGTQRSVTIERIRAGSTASGEGAEVVMNTIRPGLAVDGGTAYLVSPSGTVARVALRTLSVSYRNVAGRFAKLWEGASRDVTVLRPGVLAITGTDSTIVTSARGPTVATRPSGLEVLDTTTTPWTLTRVHAQASQVSTWFGSLLVSGWWPHPQLEDDYLGIGLAVLDPSGRERFRVFDGRPVHIVGTFLDRAYVYMLGRGERAIVDLQTGAVHGQRLGDFPWLLLDPRGGS